MRLVVGFYPSAPPGRVLERLWKELGTHRTHCVSCHSESLLETNKSILSVFPYAVFTVK